MNKLIVHKVVSIFTVVLLLLPVGIQLIHTIENHEHVICDSKEIKHFHEKEIDCSLCLVKLNNEPFTIINFNNLRIQSFQYESPKEIQRENIALFYSYKPSRAPPQLII